MNVQMNVQLSEPEGAQLLRRLDRKQKARAMLAAPTASPWSIMLQGVAVAATVGACSFFGARGMPPVLFIALTGGLVGGLVALATEHWAMRRRLDAVIALLELDSPSPP